MRRKAMRNVSKGFMAPLARIATGWMLFVGLVALGLAASGWFAASAAVEATPPVPAAPAEVKAAPESASAPAVTGKDNGKKDADFGKGRSFFGIPVGDAHKIVFVSDRSGSMTDSIDYLKYEMKRCIGQLTEKDLFDVLFMSSGPPVEMPTRKLVPATDKNKKLAFEFIDDTVAAGETSPEGSLKRAFELEPEVIYCITDGEFDRGVVDLVKQLNAEKKVKVHTIGFLYPKPETDAGKILKQIAADSGGTYTFVSEADLAKIGQEGG
jgi:hypothetical protein